MATATAMTSVTDQVILCGLMHQAPSMSANIANTHQQQTSATTRHAGRKRRMPNPRATLNAAQSTSNTRRTECSLASPATTIYPARQSAKVAERNDSAAYTFNDSGIFTRVFASNETKLSCGDG